jgi:hypothetical protein
MAGSISNEVSTFNVGPPPTQPPTASTAAPTGADEPPEDDSGAVTGDPFTKNGQGKVVQFYLPLGRFVALIKCGDFALEGRVKPTATPGDQQQWFDAIRMFVGSDEKLSIGVKPQHPVAPREAASLTGNTTSMAEKVAETLLLHREGSTVALANLDVTVEGAVLNRTGTKRIASGGLEVSVTGAANNGGRRTESVSVDSLDMRLIVRSSVARKFESEEDQIKNMHLDLDVPRVNAQNCMGVLPEIWGIRQLSDTTARMLEPPKENVEGKPAKVN